MKLHQKLDRLLALRPDVAIIQECASPERDEARGWHPPCTDRDWIGFNPHKGLGVFTFGGLRLCRDSRYADVFSLYLPVQVYGRCRLNLLGVWVADHRKIPAGSSSDSVAALRHYRPFLSAAPAVVAGDFNMLPQQMSRRAEGPGGHSVVELLAQSGLQNAGNAPTTGSGAGGLKRTHYHQRKPGRGFVVDYIFVPAAAGMRLSAFEVCDPHGWIQWSDHVPLVAELDSSQPPRALLGGET
jgi:exodeoxyribonuclease-3